MNRIAVKEWKLESNKKVKGYPIIRIFLVRMKKKKNLVHGGRNEDVITFSSFFGNFIIGLSSPPTVFPFGIFLSVHRLLFLSHFYSSYRNTFICLSVSRIFFFSPFLWPQCVTIFQVLFLLDLKALSTTYFVPYQQPFLIWFAFFVQCTDTFSFIHNYFLKPLVTLPPFLFFLTFILLLSRILSLTRFSFLLIYFSFSYYSSSFPYISSYLWFL